MRPIRVWFVVAWFIWRQRSGCRSVLQHLSACSCPLGRAFEGWSPNFRSAFTSFRSNNDSKFSLSSFRFRFSCFTCAAAVFIVQNNSCIKLSAIFDDFRRIRSVLASSIHLRVLGNRQIASSGRSGARSFGFILIYSLSSKSSKSLQQAYQTFNSKFLFEDVWIQLVRFRVVTPPLTSPNRAF